MIKVCLGQNRPQLTKIGHSTPLRNLYEYMGGDVCEYTLSIFK